MRPDALRAATAQAAQRASPKLKTRLSRGEKRNRKRIAEVGAVYDVTPAPRTPEDVLASTEQKAMPAPKAQEQVADRQRRRRRRDGRGRHLRRGRAPRPRPPARLGRARRRQQPPDRPDQRRGQEAQAQGHDRRSTSSTCWSTCGARPGASSPRATPPPRLGAREGPRRPGRQGRHRRRRDPPQATRLGLDPEKRAKADRAADYLLNKRPYLDYPTALANGWPIATGVIEGACRHLVKDRMDITGARWGLARRRSHPQTPRPPQQRRLRRLLALPPRPRTTSVHESRYANGVIPRAA